MPVQRKKSRRHVGPQLVASQWNDLRHVTTLWLRRSCRHQSSWGGSPSGGPGPWSGPVHVATWHLAAAARPWACDGLPWSRLPCTGGCGVAYSLTLCQAYAVGYVPGAGIAEPRVPSQAGKHVVAEYIGPSPVINVNLGPRKCHVRIVPSVPPQARSRARRNTTPTCPRYLMTHTPNRTLSLAVLTV